MHLTSHRSSSLSILHPRTPSSACGRRKVTQGAFSEHPRCHIRAHSDLSHVLFGSPPSSSRLPGLLARGSAHNPMGWCYRSSRASHCGCGSSIGCQQGEIGSGLRRLNEVGVLKVYLRRLNTRLEGRPGRGRGATATSDLIMLGHGSSAATP